MEPSSGPEISKKTEQKAASHHRSWVLFVAGRYLRTRRRERRNTAAFLSILGLAVGVATLITVISVMNAFQSNTIESIVAFDSYHIRVSGITAERLLEMPTRLHDIRSGVPAIKAIVPFAEIQGMARGYFAGIEGLRMRAVPADVLKLDSDLADRLRIVSGAFDLNRQQSVVLGDELARALGVGPGDQISVLTLSSGDSLASPREYNLTVSGVFRIGYYEYDRNCAFLSLDTARAMTKNLKNMHIGFKLEDRDSDWMASRDIERILVDSKIASKTVLSRDLVSWRQYNSAIFGALRVEKLMMMVIIGLIFVVVAVNIFYVLRRSVFEKMEDIGVLRSLGAPANTVQLIFVAEGAAIGLLGGLFGLALGWLLASNVDGVFRLAEAGVGLYRKIVSLIQGHGEFVATGRISFFFLDQVPSRLVPAEAIGISVVAFLSAAVAAFAASRRVSRVKPAEILRND